MYSYGIIHYYKTQARRAQGSFGRTAILELDRERFVSIRVAVPGARYASGHYLFKIQILDRAGGGSGAICLHGRDHHVPAFTALERDPLPPDQSPLPDRT